MNPTPTLFAGIIIVVTSIITSNAPLAIIGGIAIGIGVGRVQK